MTSAKVIERIGQGAVLRALIAEERESCACEADQVAAQATGLTGIQRFQARVTSQEIAARIRARGDST